MGGDPEVRSTRRLRLYGRRMALATAVLLLPCVWAKPAQSSAASQKQPAQPGGLSSLFHRQKAARTPTVTDKRSSGAVRSKTGAKGSDGGTGGKEGWVCVDGVCKLRGGASVHDDERDMRHVALSQLLGCRGEGASDRGKHSSRPRAEHKSSYVAAATTPPPTTTTITRPSRTLSGPSPLRSVRGGGVTDAADATKHAAHRSALTEGLKNGCASGLATACAKVLLQPFDTLKTVQQATRGKLSVMEAGRQLVARKGYGALYSGLGVTLVGAMPAVAVYFGVYQYSKKQLLRALPSGLTWTLVGVATSAALGNTVASVFRVPYEVVKQRLQAGVYANTGEALTRMWADGGVSAFFGTGGVTSQILRDVPYAVVTLVMYETLRRLRREALGDLRRPSPFEDSLIGAVAGGVGSFISNPMDVVKTRAYTAMWPFEDSLIGAVAGGVGSLIANPMVVAKTRVMTQPELYKGVLDAALKTYKGEGMSAFFKGSVPRLMHKIPANAIFFAAYEMFRAILRVSG